MNFERFVFYSVTFDLLNIIIWTFSPHEIFFKIELPFQNILNYPICMSEAKTLGQRQNYHLLANGRCTWDNFKKLIELIGK